MKNWGFLALFLYCGAVSAQTPASNSNVISTALPFLRISPDARSSAMGDVGVALSPDANTAYWNPSKLVFLEDSNTVSLSYSPYMPRLAKDMSLGYLSFAHRIDQRNSVGLSLNYFNLGNVDQYDENLNSLGNYSPKEFSFSASFARKYGQRFSIGMSLNYLHSALASNVEAEGTASKPINTLSVDISGYYRKNVQQFGKPALFSMGILISNLGPKVNYSKGSRSYFLPTNLKLGAANTWILNENNELTFSLDLNKLLVATPPLRDADGNIIGGAEDNVSLLVGMLGSLGDAPGGIKEEFKEISYSTGLEYWYNKQVAFRAGYFYENPEKGNRQYTTVGAGFRYQKLEFNFSYLMANQARNQLANTLRFSLLYNLSAKR